MSDRAWFKIGIWLAIFGVFSPHHWSLDLWMTADWIAHGLGAVLAWSSRPLILWHDEVTITEKTKG